MGDGPLASLGDLTNDILAAMAVGLSGTVSGTVTAMNGNGAVSISGKLRSTNSMAANC